MVFRLHTVPATLWLVICVFVTLGFFCELSAGKNELKMPKDIAGTSQRPEYGVTVNSWSVIYTPPSSNEMIWTVDKNFLSEEDIRNFHEYCGNDQVNRFYFFPDLDKDMQDKTRNCTWINDLIVVHVTVEAKNINANFGVTQAYRLVTIEPFLSIDPASGKKKKCKISSNITDFGGNRFMVGIDIKDLPIMEPGQPDRVFKIIDIPDSMTDLITNNFGEDWLDETMFWHADDFTGADAKLKNCVLLLGANESDEETIRKVCQISCSNWSEKDDSEKLSHKDKVEL